MVRAGASAALLAGLTALAGAGAAADVAVRTGEHPGFTRLVVDDPAIREWSLGRSGDGYALRVSPKTGAFDLSGVFRTIGRGRISGVTADADGLLRLRLGCDCHAEPIEARPGVIVIDIHDGPAAAGSRYERPLAPGLAALRPRGRPVPFPAAAPAAPAPYDWRAIPRERPSADLNLALPGPTVAAMRQSLVEQLSRGAAAGAVEFVDKPPSPPPAPQPPVGQMQILAAPGFESGMAPPSPRTLTPEGSACVSDDRLDIRAWGGERPVAEQIASALAGLTGEFDAPQPGNLRRAVRYYLYLGFGAEARQLLEAFPWDDPDRPLWDSMARSLDGEPMEGGPFRGMEGCDTSAALWSVLAEPPQSSRSLNKPAILRSFSALPPHLRRHLGPDLVEAALVRGDTEGARVLRDAMMRGPGAVGAEVELADTRLAIKEGAGDPVPKLAEISTSRSPAGAEALALMVERQITTGQVPAAADVTALSSMVGETAGTPLGAQVGHAYRLALAATGDYEQAFRQKSLAPDAEVEIWRLLATSGADSAVLTYAVLAPDAAVPALPDQVRRDLAYRLIALGLPQPAARWLPLSPQAPEDRLLAARLAALQGDARQTGAILSGGAGPLTGEQPVPPMPRPAPPAPSPAEAPALQGPLARGKALVADSAETRARIEALLRRENP